MSDPLHVVTAFLLAAAFDFTFIFLWANLIRWWANKYGLRGDVVGCGLYFAGTYVLSVTGLGGIFLAGGLGFMWGGTW